MALPTTPESEAARNLLVTPNGCVAFLGSGATIPPAGTWKELVREIANSCGVTFDDGIPEADYPDLIDDCMARDEDRCNQTLRRILPEHSSSSRTALRYIHSFNLKALVTTNFDPYIRILGSAEKYKHVHVYPDLPLTDGVASRLFYIHGYFSSEDADATIRNVVLGRRSFDQAYRNSLLPGRIARRASHTVVFLT
jgi:hypothetical protein